MLYLRYFFSLPLEKLCEAPGINWFFRINLPLNVILLQVKVVNKHNVLKLIICNYNFPCLC